MEMHGQTTSVEATTFTQTRKRKKRPTRNTSIRKETGGSRETSARDLRRRAKELETFEDFDADDYNVADGLLWGAGFPPVRSVESMHVSARDMLMKDIRNDRRVRRRAKDLRLLIELFKSPIILQEGGGGRAPHSSKYIYARR